MDMKVVMHSIEAKANGPSSRFKKIIQYKQAQMGKQKHKMANFCFSKKRKLKPNFNIIFKKLIKKSLLFFFFSGRMMTSTLLVVGREILFGKKFPLPLHS